MGHNNEQNQLNNELQQQIDMQRAELQEKTEAIVQEKLGTVKSEGAPNWSDPNFIGLSKPVANPSKGWPWNRFSPPATSKGM